MDGCQFGMATDAQIDRCSATWLSNFDLDAVMLRCRAPINGIAGCSHDHGPDRACFARENEPLGITYAMAVSYAVAGSVFNSSCFSTSSALKHYSASAESQRKENHQIELIFCTKARALLTLPFSSAPGHLLKT